MPSFTKLALGLIASAALTACVEDTGDAAPPAATPAASSFSTPEERACLRDVASTTGNSDVYVVSSEFSQAGTNVTIGVGSTGRWSCTAFSDGTTANIMSTTGEGFL
ncbi:hypothetical protein [Marivita hallyeonensis]|uniref:Uncharacterized protein n=1 Tax=Marivita hallyeonensis TaxID=996342 RepID=A0A1M5VKE1_9RHOB|nr:hypothetical protein [Marivita hallyeonensis]SHH75524.1 hypothetical protein SAMN05443551_2912 [Marivita hallyeonensis]